MKTVTKYQCLLGKAQPQTMDAEQVKQQGWQQQHILVVTTMIRAWTWVEREPSARIGNGCMGRRSIMADWDQNSRPNACVKPPTRPGTATYPGDRLLQCVAHDDP